MTLTAPDASSHPDRRSWAAWIARRLPGLALCGAVAGAAMLLQTVEQKVFGRAWLESLALAIVVGVTLRTAWTPGERWRPGVEWSAKVLLEVAVALLGASISARVLAAAGAALLFGVAGVVAAAIPASYGLGRALGLPHRLAVLVACGNSICGNSAIAAVAPVIGAEGEDVSAAIAFTAVLGVVAVLGLPLLGGALHMGALSFGAFAGLTVYAVPQVLAAAAPMGPAAVRFGTLVKLVRVLMLGPVCFVLALMSRRRRRATDTPAPARGASGDGRSGGDTAPKLVPWFIPVFLLMVAARSVGAIPAPALAGFETGASLLAVVSMGALGLGTDLRVVARAGGRVTAAVVASLGLLGAISLGLVSLLHLT